MTFIIDTGLYEPDAASAWRIDKRDGIMNGVLDSLPAEAAIMDAVAAGHPISDAVKNAAQKTIDAAVIAMILGKLYEPRQLRTVRMHLIALWPLIQNIAFRDPAAFDEVVVAYAEITTVLREQEDTAEIAAVRTELLGFKKRGTSLDHFAAVLPTLTEIAARRSDDVDALTQEFTAHLTGLCK